MNLCSTYRRENVLLVDVDANHVLIDQEREQVHVINESAAWVWAQLGTNSETEAPAVIDFVDQLREKGLLGDKPVGAVLSNACLGEAPKLLDSAPLLVAAANCPSFSDPFFEG
jgi:hypothetical protein